MAILNIENPLVALDVQKPKIITEATIAGINKLGQIDAIVNNAEAFSRKTWSRIRSQL
jgi:NADP-dependent 3-hydroxy acid dehydrogenase YdfG